MKNMILSGYTHLIPGTATEVARDRSVGIANRYQLDGLEIEPRWRCYFSHPSKPAVGHTQPPVQLLPRLFPMGKATAVWR